MSLISLEVSKAILCQRAAIAEKLAAREFARRPELEDRYGRVGRDKCVQDAGYHLSYLAEAVATDNPNLFADYIGWTKIMLARRGVPASDLALHLESMAEILNEILPAALSPPARQIVEQSLLQLPDYPDDLPSFMEPGHPHSLLAHQYLQSLLHGERHIASQLILDAVKRGVTIKEIYLDVFQRTQYEIGRLWQTNQICVAREHYCTAATQLIMSQLYPYIFTGEKHGGIFIGTCVAGDLHEIGVRMITDYFEMAGWDTYYLGANTPHDSVVRTVTERKANVLGISATITYHVHDVEQLIRKVRAEPTCDGVKIIVGGYPFNVAPDLWRAVDADGSSRDAAGVVTLVEELTGRKATS
ncbi:MAG: cobalamin B12-binding domain protein [Chthoniobacteraceae bacterium]|nr:cobalamin B12-binding domain protein [Chthoniobacteraceae bacterium]